MAAHERKSRPDQSRAMWAHRERAESRRDDRGYAVGDLLELREWDPDAGRYTGSRPMARVTHLASGPARRTG